MTNNADMGSGVSTGGEPLILPAAEGQSIDPAAKWYCVHAHPKREHIAAASLLTEEGLDVFCPRIRYRKKTRRGMVWFVEAMFPAYLFARFEYARHHRFVRHCLGVSTIVHFGRNVAVLADGIVETLQQRCATEHGIPVIEIAPAINQGDTVTVGTGPFNGVEALVTQVLPARERVKILIEFLGREIELELGKDTIIRNGPIFAHV